MSLCKARLCSLLAKPEAHYAKSCGSGRLLLSKPVCKASPKATPMLLNVCVKGETAL